MATVGLNLVVDVEEENLNVLRHPGFKWASLLSGPYAWVVANYPRAYLRLGPNKQTTGIIKLGGILIAIGVGAFAQLSTFLDGAIKGASKALACRLFVANSTIQLEAGAPSKNASKKELKKKYKLDARRGKEEENLKKAAGVPSSSAQKSLAADDSDMDPTQYFDNRLKHSILLEELE